MSLQGGEKGSVPLNFLHILVGRDAFPAVTDCTLFFNTDEELKKAMAAVWDGCSSPDHYHIASYSLYNKGDACVYVCAVSI